MELPELLRLFGYTPEWIATGVLDERFLREQFQTYSTSEDQNPEHYRARAFDAFIRRTSSISDTHLDALLALRDNGTDGCDLSDGRFLDLILYGLLTDQQYDGLAQRHPQVLQAPIGRIYLREGLRRKIKGTGLVANAEEIHRCADSQLQLYLFEREDLDKSMIEWLAKSGGNKAIRNRATALLKSRRFL